MKRNNRLQPFHVFKAEVTRVNELYWRTRYAYSRVSAVLGAIATTGRADPDPRVDQLWPSIEEGERRHATVPFSSFRVSLEDNLASLRLTSVLYLCSAFENALSGYFVLCCLYRPTALDPAWPHGACPRLAGNTAFLDQLKKLAVDAAGANIKKQRLKGSYSLRVGLLDSMFRLGLNVAALPMSGLDAHYKVRHLIAHDQGLATADDPSLSARELLQGTVAVPEPEWKRMLADFAATVDALDKAVRTKVVTDLGMTLAVARVLDRSPSRGTRMMVAKLRHTVSTEWRTDLDFPDVLAALAHLGRSTTPERAVHSRTVL